MNKPYDNTNRAGPDHSRATPRLRGWPWWEPYVFTLGVLLAFIGFIVACGVFGDFLDHIFLGWPLFLGLCTIGALIGSFRKAGALASPVWSALMSVWMGMAAVVHVTKAEHPLALWYGLLAAIWCIITTRAVVMRGVTKRERLARMERTVETVRRAVDRKVE